VWRARKRATVRRKRKRQPVSPGPSDASEMKQINQMTVWGARRVGFGKVKTRTLENRKGAAPGIDTKTRVQTANTRLRSNRCPATE
jgi:hypothetical protein